MRVCDWCKILPDKFQTDDGKDAYFFVILEIDQEPVAIMSDLSYAFRICCERNPTRQGKERLVCINCAERYFGVIEERED